MKNPKNLDRQSSADRITYFLPLYYNPLVDTTWELTLELSCHAGFPTVSTWEIHRVIEYLNFTGVLLREMVSTLHLSWWKAIFHNCSHWHCASLSRSLCRVRSSLFDLTRYAIVSSAKSLIVESSPVGMSFM
jgi:hypothetical protein